jgi:hypothetical protein
MSKTKVVVLIGITLLIFLLFIVIFFSDLSFVVMDEEDFDYQITFYEDNFYGVQLQIEMWGIDFSKSNFEFYEITFDVDKGFREFRYNEQNWSIIEDGTYYYVYHYDNRVTYEEILEMPIKDITFKFLFFTKRIPINFEYVSYVEYEELVWD